jgi:hypothetical protein
MKFRQHKCSIYSKNLNNYLLKKLLSRHSMQPFTLTRRENDLLYGDCNCGKVSFPNSCFRPIHRFLAKIPDSYRAVPVDSYPVDCVAHSTAITLFSPLARFTSFWLRDRTATRWIECPLRSYHPILSSCTLYRFLVKIPDSYPLDAAGPIFCAAITMYSTLAHFTGSW